MAKHVIRRERLKALRTAEKSTLFRATQRWARMSETKVRLDADLIRGMPINSALEQLQFSNRRAAHLLDKVVRSALANAEHQIGEQKLGLDVDDLYVQHVEVDKGPVLKRWMTRSRGMAYPIHKHTCHIAVTLAPMPKAEAKATAEQAA